MEEELARLREAALAEIAACGTEAELEAVRVRYLGRKGSLTEAVRGLGRVPPAERPALGALVNQAKEAVEAAVAVSLKRLAAPRRVFIFGIGSVPHLDTSIIDMLRPSIRAC